MTVKFTPRARQDLIDIGDWIARDSRKRARSFVLKLRERANRLDKNPSAFELVEGLSGIRRCPYGPYLIFYRVGPAGVEILRVLHGARNYPALFN